MKIQSKEFHLHHLNYIVRSANEQDAQDLSIIRLQIDGETENLDREKGEAYIDKIGFKKMIRDDTESPHNLFLVVEAHKKIVGFSRCEGNNLKRTSHKAEFGVCILKEYWGYGMGSNLLKESIRWADSTGIKKMILNVLETNDKAIMLCQKYGFEVEGILKKDKLLSDGNYYHTIIMSRLKN